MTRRRLHRVRKRRLGRLARYANRAAALGYPRFVAHSDGWLSFGNSGWTTMCGSIEEVGQALSDIRVLRAIALADR